MKNHKNAASYLQYGCGCSVGNNWLNYDSSPTLRLQRVPGFAGLVKILGGVRFPDEVMYGDICKGLLSPSASCAGIYASHVLEHLSLEDFGIALNNTYEMLIPGGVFRLIVPDLDARARNYVALLDAESDVASTIFMESAHLGMKRRPKGVAGRLRNQFGNSRHLWMWDEFSMTQALREAGFENIRRCDFNDSKDLAFREVEDPGRFFDEEYSVRELAMECRRPL